ncbi:hypothetical protein C7S15_6649 [Burkholderia cepacia]|nr:hypothetical protein [Burkholderia cepacia]
MGSGTKRPKPHGRPGNTRKNRRSSNGLEMSAMPGSRSGCPRNRIVYWVPHAPAPTRLSRKCNTADTAPKQGRPDRVKMRD